MIYESSCPCGATIKIVDEKRTYINGGGAPDAKGRVFVSQVSFDAWLDAHKGHKASELKEFFHR